MGTHVLTAKEISVMEADTLDDRFGKRWEVCDGFAGVRAECIDHVLKSWLGSSA